VDLHVACKKDARDLPVVCVHCPRLVEEVVYHAGVRTHVIGNVLDHEICFSLPPFLHELNHRTVRCRLLGNVDTKEQMHCCYIGKDVFEVNVDNVISVRKDARYVRDCLISILLDIKHFGSNVKNIGVEKRMHESYHAYVRYLLYCDTKANKKQKC